MVLYVELPQPPSGWLLRTTSGHCSVDFFFSFFHSGQFNVENAQQCCLQQTVSKLQYPLLFAFALVTTSHINLARDTFGRQFEPYPLWCLGHCSQTVVVIKLLQTSAFKIQCKGCTMHYLILDPSQWLVWHVVLIKHCFNNCNLQEEAEWFQFCWPTVKTEKEGKGKSAIEKVDSIFRLNILQNPNRQNPAHPDRTKFRLRFRVPYSIFPAIVHMFTAKNCWNFVSTSDFYGKPSHLIPFK